MTDPTAALAAIEAANRARGEVWTALATAQSRLDSCGSHGLGGARLALDDALRACDQTRSAIIAALAETGKLREGDGG